MRLIAKIEVKNDNVVKGLQFEGVRKICSPLDALDRLRSSGCEEIFMVDNTKSVFGLDPNFAMLELLASEATLPITFGGGLASVEHVLTAFELGASRVYLNSQTFEQPNLVRDISNICGKQAITGGVEYRVHTEGRRCFGAAGREATKHFLRSRLDMLVDQGVGEIIVSSIDKDGSKEGLDWDVCEEFYDIPVPVLLAGGGSSQEFDQYQNYQGVEGLVFSSVVLGL